jgi:hypothetical protein
MAALTKDVLKTHRQRPDRYSIPVKASTTIYKGGLVAVDATGYAIPGADTAALVIMGVADSAGNDNSSGASGAINVQVEFGKVVRFVASAATQAWVGQPALVVDDQTVAIAGTVNAIKVGKVLQVDSATSVWVYVDGLGGN